MLKVIAILTLLATTLNPQSADVAPLVIDDRDVVKMEELLEANKSNEDDTFLSQLIEREFSAENLTERNDEAVEPSPISEYKKPFNPLTVEFDFDPGFLISDPVFFNNNSMTIEGIQSFMEHMVPECYSGGNPCLKDVKLDIPDEVFDERVNCAPISKTKNVSAAEAIKIVSDSCGINPQVILAHLEKEQGLVTSTSPTSYMYRAAMGYNCPDSNVSACGRMDGGFWKQIYEGSKQKLWYGEPESAFNYYPVGSSVNIKYHPNAECGFKNVTIKNRATASLYYYTPYVPNRAAINNIRGLGNECSSYGNRNFFWLFNDWFGDSRAENLPTIISR